VDTAEKFKFEALAQNVEVLLVFLQAVSSAFKAFIPGLECP
jgi:hypothetical protein